MRKSLIIAAALAAIQSLPAAASDVMQRAEKAFGSQLALMRAPNNPHNPQLSWIGENAIYHYALHEYALRGIDVNLRIEGRAAVSAHLRALAEAAPRATVENMQFFPTLEPDVVFVQYDLVTAEYAAKRSSALVIIQMNGDQIVKFTQLSRSDSLQALKLPSAAVN